MQRSNVELSECIIITRHIQQVLVLLYVNYSQLVLQWLLMTRKELQWRTKLEQYWTTTYLTIEDPFQPLPPRPDWQYIRSHLDKPRHRACTQGMY